MSRILVVDDDADFVEMMRLCLERDGHAVTWASNREEGMQAAGRGDADLLILDVMMNEPDDGIAMAQDLRRAGFAKPILMMSSISMVTGLAYGKDDAVTPVDEFLEKPVSPHVLLATVAELLRTRAGEVST